MSGTDDDDRDERPPWSPRDDWTREQIAELELFDRENDIIVDVLQMSAESQYIIASTVFKDKDCRVLQRASLNQSNEDSNGKTQHMMLSLSFGWQARDLFFFVLFCLLPTALGSSFRASIEFFVHVFGGDFCPTGDVIAHVHIK